MLIVQNAAEPAGIRNAIVDLVSLGAIDVRVASAYVTLSGTNILLAAISDAVGQAAFMAMPKTLITSFDFGLTEPHALRHWCNLTNATVVVSGADVVAQGSLMPTRAFHPKMYAFGNHAQDVFGNNIQVCNALVGSANLTSRGFSVNTEAAWVQPGILRREMDQAFTRAAFETTPLTEYLLSTYEALRQTQPRPRELVQETQSVPPPTPINVEALPQFRVAVENGVVDPAAFNAMSVQVEGLQGGSGNQLELPRGAYRFFR